jgi:hypothetical protein
MDSAGLTLNLPQLGRIGDLFRPTVHVTLTARSELHSGLVPRLEYPESPDVEGKDEWQSPYKGSVDHREECCDHHASDRRHDSPSESLVPLTRSDVGDAR